MSSPSRSPLFVATVRKLDRLANKLPEQSEYRSTPEAAKAAYEKHIAIVAKARPLREVCEALTCAFDMHPVGSATQRKVEELLGRDVDDATAAAILVEAACAKAWAEQRAREIEAERAANRARRQAEREWLASLR